MRDEKVSSKQGAEQSAIEQREERMMASRDQARKYHRVSGGLKYISACFFALAGSIGAQWTADTSRFILLIVSGVCFAVGLSLGILASTETQEARKWENYAYGDAEAVGRLKEQARHEF